MTILALLLLLLLLSMQVCPFSKYYCLINVLYTPSSPSPLAYSFFFSTKLNVFFLFLTSIPISCCRCCHSWVNCFHVINFIDGKFVTLLVHSLLFFFFVDVCYNGYGICRLFFFFLHPVNDLHFRSKHIFRNAKESKKWGGFLFVY